MLFDSNGPVADPQHFQPCSNVEHLPEVLMRQCVSLRHSLARGLWSNCCVSVFAPAGSVIFLLAGKSQLPLSYLRRTPSVRWIVGILLAVAIIGWFACRFETPTTDTRNPRVPTQWRRTADGWEKVSALSTATPEQRAANELAANSPHPVIMSMFVGLLSVLVLVAFSPATQFHRTRPPRSTSVPELAELPLRSRAWLADSKSA